MNKANAKVGTFEELLAITGKHVQPIAKALREMVFEVDANACEVVRLGDRAATYGVGPRKMIDGYVYILPHKKWVNLGFYQGDDLPDPEGLLEGTGAKMRHVKVHSLCDVNRSAVRTLLEGALGLRKASSHPRLTAHGGDGYTGEAGRGGTGTI